mgnify:CR=1 FL=1
MAIPYFLHIPEKQNRSIMTKKKNNILIPKSLTKEEVQVRLEANVIKVKLLEKDIWEHFSKNILLHKNRIELTQQFFNCSQAAAEFLMSLTLADLLTNTPESLEEERRLLDGKAISK